MRAAKRKIHGAALAALLLMVATSWPAAAKAGPAAGAAGSRSPLLAAVDVGLGAGQVLDVAGAAGVELALEAPRSWTYLEDLARFSEDAKWRLEVDVQGLAAGCLEPSPRLKTRVRGYQLSRGGNKAVKNSLIPYAARDCDPSRTPRHVGGVFITTDPLGYVDGPNLYQFSLNNPVNFSDPMGLEAGWIIQREKRQLEQAGLDPEAAIEAALQRQFEEEVALESTMLGSRLNYEGYDWSHDESVLNNEAFLYFRGRGKNTTDASQWAGFTVGQGQCDPTQPHCLVDWEVLSTGVTVMEAGVGISLAVFDPALLMGGGGGVNVAAFRAGLRADLRATGAGRGLMGASGRSRVPYTLADLDGAMGSTDMFGNITIDSRLSGVDFIETLRHESVHRFFSPRNTGPLNRFRARLGQTAYNDFHLVTYIEEAIAEGYAQRSFLAGVRWPISAGYVTPGRLAAETTFFVGGEAALMHQAYQWASDGN